jgi:hypothetical protein
MAHNYTVVVNIKHPEHLNRPAPANADQAVHVVASSPEEAEDRAVGRVMAGLFPGQDIASLPKQMRPRVRSVSKGEAVVEPVPADTPPAPVPPTSIPDEDDRDEDTDGIETTDTPETVNEDK